MKRLACIDLGTNTFHVLIVKSDQHGFTELYRKREYVILAEQGIEVIGEAPLARAFKAIDLFKIQLEDYVLDELKIIGTEALRRASNGHIITAYIKKQLGVEPEIIGGKREAMLILKGTQLKVDMSAGHFCIMDIGGGSVEFIIVSDGQVTFMKSYRVGVTVLFNAFHHSDPISEDEQLELTRFLDESLSDLLKHLNSLTGSISLVGASGSYEVLQSVIEGEVKRASVSIFCTDQFYDVSEEIIPLNETERSEYEGIPHQRVKLIPVAFLLIKYILDQREMDRIIVSPYALKEGVLSEMM